MSNKRKDKTKAINRKWKVVVYTVPACSLCDKIKRYFVKNDINFIEKNILKDKSAAIEMMRKSKQDIVPQTIIDGKLVVGYDTPRLNKLFEL